MNRGPVVGSSLVHAALVVGLFLYGRTAPRYVAGPDAIQVALLDARSLPAAAAPPAPADAPRHDAAEIAPTDESGVKVQPPKKKKDEKAKPDEAPPPAPMPAPALPYEATGAAGLRGQVALDNADFAFTYYLLLVRSRIAQNWTPPNGIPAGGQPVRAVVYFRIARDGSLSGFRLEGGSGVEFFDRSAMRAAVLANPMPRLPDGYSGNDLGVHFGFEYVAP